MKPKSSLRFFLSLSGSALLLAAQARAVNYYWDTNATTAGLGDTAGIWGSSAFQVSGFPSFSAIDGTFNGFSNTATTGLDQITFGTTSLALGSTASTIGIVGGGVTIHTISFGAGQGNQGVTLGGGGGSITLAGTTPTIIASNTGSNTIGAELAGTSGLTKSGAGTLVLTGSNSFTGGLTLSGGTLQVGNSTTGNLTSQALTFSGTGTFQVQQADGGAQNMGLLSFSAGDAAITSTAASGSASQTVTFASLAVRTPGATANFSLAGNTNESQNEIVLTDTTNAPLHGAGSNDPGIFFGGTDYARYYTDGPYFTPVIYGADANASALQGASASGITVTTGAAADVKLTGAVTSQNSATLNTLNLGANNLTLTNTSQVLSVNGILSTGSTISTAGLLQPATAGGELVLRVNNGTLVMNPIIQDNTSASSLTKSGAGTLQLNDINTYSGTTYINGGLVDARGGIAGGSAVWGSGGITINQGATLFFNPTTQAIQNTPGFTVPGAITLTGGAGTSTIRFAGNDNKFVLSGGMTGQAGVAQTLALIQGGILTNGDRQSIQVTGALADGSGGILGVSVDFSNASGQAQRGYVNLSGPNTFTGDLTITNSRGLNGTGNNPGAWVTIGGLRHDGFTAPTLISEGTGFLGAGANYSGNISISNGNGGLTTLGFLTSANQILNGVISGTGSLNQRGSGTLTLNAANTFSGTTTIAGSGPIIMGNALALQNSPLVTTSGANTLTLSGAPSTLQLGGLSGASGNLGTIITGSAFSNISALTLNPQAGVSVTYGGVLADGAAGMSLIKTGPGTQIFSGNNTYTGVTTVNQGTLILSGTNSNSGGFSLNGGILQFARPASQAATGTVAVGTGATLAINVGGASDWSTATSGNGSIGGLLAGLGGQSGGAVSYTGSVTLGFDTTNASSVAYAGSIANVGDSLAINKLGANTLILSGTNTYSGGTTITSGTLQFAKLVSQPASGTVTVGTGTTLAVNVGGAGEWTTGTSGNGTIGGLLAGLGGQSGGTVTFNGNVALGFDTTNGDPTQTYTGAIANVGTSLGITKLGPNTLALGGANTYTGTTTVNGGTLLLDVAGGGSLSSSSPLTLGGGNFQVKGNASGASAQTLGALTLIANRNNTITLDPNGGTSTILTLGNAWTRGVGSSLLIDYSSANAGTRQVLTAGATTGVALSNGIYGSILVRGNAGVVGFATRAAGANQPIIRYDEATLGTTLADNSNVAATNFTTLNTVYTGGTLTWTNGITNRSVNSLTIDTSINGGTIDMGVAGNILTLTSGGILFKGSNNATLTGGQVGANNSEVIVHQTGAGTLTLSSRISSGSGSLTKDGTGRLIVTSTNSYSGSTTLNGGTLQYAIRTAFGSSTLHLGGGTLLQKITEEGNSAALTMANNIVLTGGQATMNVDFATAKDQWFSGVVSGSGSLRVTGEGTFVGRALTLTNNNTFSGGVTLDTSSAFGAWIQLGNANALGTGTVTINVTGGNQVRGLGASTNLTSGTGVPNNIVINSGATLNLGGGSGSMLLSGIISGSGNLNKSDTAATTFTLSGANSYGGTTRVTTGTLALGANNVLPDTSNVTLGSATLNASTFTDTAGTLAVSGTATINLGSGGALAFANSSAVTWTGSLDITGTFVPGASIRFGTTSGGLTSGQLATISVNGSGAGTYTLNASGYLVVASGSPYATWAGGAAFTDDNNGDGVKNGLAWILGAVDPNVSALDKLPTFAKSGAFLTLSFTRENPYSPAKLYVEYDNNLDGWTKVEIPVLATGTHTIGGDIEVVVNSPGSPTPDSIQVKIPTTHAGVGGKLFARLSATEN